MNFIVNTLELQQDRSKTIPAMEGLRGFAVLLVFLVHYGLFVEPWISPESMSSVVLNKFRSYGNAGVDLFFVISGYLIYGILIKKPINFFQFFWRRIVRIYPVYLLVLAAYLGLGFVFPEVSKLPDRLDFALLYIAQNILLLPGIFDIVPIVTQAWSLSYEMFYYLIAPLFVKFVPFKTLSHKTRILFLLVLSALLFIVLMKLDGPVRLLMFVSGMIVYEVVEESLNNRSFSVGVGALLLSPVLLLLLEHFDVHDGYKTIVLFVLFYFVCVDCFNGYNNIISKFMSLDWLRWFGNMSYSYYLMHGLAIRVFIELLEKIYPPSASGTLVLFLLLPIVFVFSVVFSFPLFAFVEKPLSLKRK